MDITTKIITLISGQWFLGAIWTAKESDPSSWDPARQWTNPPYILRQALPDPCL